MIDETGLSYLKMGGALFLLLVAHVLAFTIVPAVPAPAQVVVVGSTVIVDFVLLVAATAPY